MRRLLGAARAFEWLTTGRRLGADEARDWGLVSEVVADEELPERMHEVAALYAAMPTRAVWQTKRLLDAAESEAFAEQLELEATTQAEMTHTPDFAEGVKAFLEKREATFTGASAVWPHPIRLTRCGRPAALAAHGRAALAPRVAAPVRARRLDVCPRAGRARQLGDRARSRAPRRRALVVGRPVRPLPDARLRVRVPRRRPVPAVPWLGGDLSGRPRDRPAGSAAALEDAFPHRARDSGLRPHHRAAVRPARRRVPRRDLRALRGPVSARLPRPERVLPPVHGADVELPAAAHRPLPDAGKRHPATNTGGNPHDREPHDRSPDRPRSSTTT